MNEPQLPNNGLHREMYDIVVEEYEFIKPEKDEVEYILDNVIKGCRDVYFHTNDYRFNYDIKFTNITNKEEIN